jgi:RNA polymerase sigma factor (sigma-70 family)
LDDLSDVISRVRAGEREAYGQIVERFEQMAVGYATALLGDAHLAEDAAQEAFLQAFVDLAQLREAAAFPGWFRRIVHKHCDRIHRRRRVQVVPLDEEQWAPSDATADPMEAGDRRELLGHALQRLPEDERAVVSLFYLQQYSQAEVAAFLEVPVTTVNNRMHSARGHLKQELLEMAEQEREPTGTTPLAGKVQEQIEALTTLHEALAEPIREILSDSLQTQVGVRVVVVDHKLGLKVLQPWPCPCCTYAFEPGNDQGRICFDINMELAACMVGRPIGRGDDIRVIEVRNVEQDEWERISPFAGRIMRQVVALWSGVVEMEIGAPEVETNPAYVMDGWIRARDPMIRVRFEVTWDGRESYIDLCYPAPSLTAGLERLRERTA